MKTIDGIDLSHWNGKVDFEKVKAAGVQFVMLKMGGEENGEGSYKIDPKFLPYYNKAKEAGLYVGAYMFAGKKCYDYCAEENVAFFMKFMRDKKIELDYPFAIDIEAQPTITRILTTDYTIAWCEAVEKCNFFAMIYASDISGFVERLDSTKLTKYAFWTARYGKVPEHKSAIWQYSSTGKIDGVKGYVDLNMAAYDIAEVIYRKGLNKFKEEK